MSAGTELSLYARALPRACRSILVLCATLLLAALPLHAGSPRVTHIYPAGGQRGGEIEVTCKGSNLQDARTMLFDEPGFEITATTADKGSFKARIKITPDARLGEHTFRVITASGIADVRLFYVSPFPLQEEQEDPKAPGKPQVVALNTTLYGRTPAEDEDRYEVELRAGQRLTAEVIGARLQTQNLYDPYVEFQKADGTVLLGVDDCTFSRQDPVASLVAPEDGKYRITVRDATNVGPGECHYLLHIGDFPRPLAVYPPGGPAGEEIALRLLTASGDVLERRLTLPNKPHERFALFPNEAVPTPNFIRVSAFPNVLEVEPNNEANAATVSPTPLPLAVNGMIDSAGDIDFFKFTAKQGQAYDVNVYARQLRSPLDSVLSIYDAKGNRIQQNDDDGQPDSHLRWTAPANGEFYLSVKDQQGRGGLLFTYRVEIQNVAPQLATWLPEMVANSSQERRAIVVPKGNRYASLLRIKRGDASGPVSLALEGLPSGIAVSTDTVDKSVDTVPAVFEAGPETESGAKAFEIKATLTEPLKDSTMVSSRVQHDVDIAENGNQRAFYSIREHCLPIAVVDPVPLRLTLEAPKVPVVQNGSLNLKVIAERKDGFKGPINLAILYSPPGIGTPGTVQIKEGDTSGTITISANDKASAQKWKTCVVGSADFGNGPVWISTQLIELEVAAPFVTGQIQRTFIDQGDSTHVTVRLEQKIPFEGKARLSLQGLPPGITADEQEITSEDKEVKFTVKATSAASPATYRQLFCQFTHVKNGEPIVANLAQGGILRVDRATTAKNATSAK